ncbi:MAG: dihydrolipoyl dehydrogenase [Gammaproteobacteria bacterium]|nr:dihydrolipoyl dehydrogenase [Gammaproteobacteria bacterium]MDH5731731.1 dihydrolipoyl dehydrogenase [Gammaproteobacteria bacterium]
MFDVLVIGAGPGGYVAAIRAAQLGLQVACVDAWCDENKQPSPGGTCLNVGCIPSKALIESSELYHKAQHEFTMHGIHFEQVKVDLHKMLARKDQVVRELTQGVSALFAANKIKFFHGHASFLQQHQVKVTSINGNSSELLEAKNIIIATGSTPSPLASVPFDHQHIVDSTGALAFTEVPKRLGIIGAGVIALELGSVWQRLGAEVTLYKTRPGLLPEADESIAKEATKYFQQQGLQFKTGVNIKEVKVIDGECDLRFEMNNQEQLDRHDKIIVAIGRRPNTENLFKNDIGVQLDAKGFIQVDEFCQTQVNTIFAIGDVVRGPMLAHKAEEEGVMVAERIAGEHALAVLKTVPAVIYTDPEIAWVGQTEQQLKQANIPYRVGSFPFNANGRARAINNTKGLIKILAHEHTDRILGVHMIGPQVSELIAQAKIAMDFQASSEDLCLTMFAHPTLSEAFHEAAFSVQGRAIHAVQKKAR